MVVSRVRLRGLNANSGADTDGDVVADLVELLEDVLLDLGADLGGLKADGVDEELLLNLGEGVEEQAGLGPVVREGLRTLADQTAIGLTAGGGKETTALLLVGLLGVALVESVRRVYIVSNAPGSREIRINLQAAVFLWMKFWPAPSRLLL